MKILMFYAPSFWYKTYQKTIEHLPEVSKEELSENTLVVFYHVEAEDTERKTGVLNKFLKNIKWLSGKFKTRNIVLHSFNHLSVSKAPPEFTISLIEEAKERLLNSGFKITETPFGYLNEWKIHVAGDSLAKVFKEL